MRNPDDAILSHMVQIEKLIKYERTNSKINDLAGLLIRDWLRYYRFVDSHSSRLTVVLSEKAFKDPLGTIETIFEHAGVGEDLHRSAKLSKAHKQFTTRDATKARGSTSYPSEERNRLKNFYRTFIEKSGRIDEARRLYQKVATRV